MGKPAQFLTKVENGHQRIDVVEFLDLVRIIGLSPAVTVSDLARAVGAPLVGS